MFQVRLKNHKDTGYIRLDYLKISAIHSHNENNVEKGI